MSFFQLKGNTPPKICFLLRFITAYVLLVCVSVITLPWLKFRKSLVKLGSYVQLRPGANLHLAPRVYFWSCERCFKMGANLIQQQVFLKQHSSPRYHLACQCQTDLYHKTIFGQTTIVCKRIFLVTGGNTSQKIFFYFL